MRGLPQYNSYIKIILLLASALFILVTYKASEVCFTHDESFSFLKYTPYSAGDIIHYRTDNISPNNHVLNSLSLKFFSQWMGTAEVSLRMGTLMCFGLFLYGSFIISRMFSGWLSIGIFIILTAHPYLLDFMSLSRGYGMASSFVMLSMMLWMKSIHDNYKVSYFVTGLVSAALAVWCNFAWLNFFLVAPLAYIFMQAFFQEMQTGKEKRNRVFASLMILLLVGFILSWLIYQPLKIILDRDLLYGGTTGFWFDTVNSLVKQMAYEQAYSSIFILLVKGLIVLVFLGAAMRIIWSLLHGKSGFGTQFLAFSFLSLLGLVSVSVIQYVFAGSFFPQERTALIYIVPFLITLVALIMSFQQDHIATSSIKCIELVLSNIFLAECFLAKFKIFKQYFSLPKGNSSKCA